MSSKIDRIILRHSTRGMERLFESLGRALCMPAAEAFTKLSQGRVFLYTGFYANGRGETDGPIGAYFLYRALKILGFSPFILTDESCSGYFEELEVKSFTRGDDTDENFHQLLVAEKPVAHFAIERLSRNEDGLYLNFRGQDVGEFCPRLDRLFSMAKTPTFAIGDGGNEIGMGNFAEFLKAELGIFPAQTSCDYPIIASVSNWGAYGFLACLELVTKKNILLPTFDEVKTYLSHIVSRGATDGISGRNEMSVDGKGYHVDGEILAALVECTAEFR